MSGRRLDDLGRWAAGRESRRDAAVCVPRAGPRPFDGVRIDALSRALALPISRRRAIGVISGTLLAGSTLRPRRVLAASGSCPPSGDPTSTQKCETAPDKNGNAAIVCVPEDWHCCSSTTCAVGCKPYKVCRNAGAADAHCDDTPAMCMDPGFGVNGTQPQFCAQTLAVPDGLCATAHSEVHGWCCRPGETCNSGQFGRCDCLGEDCGNQCCKKGVEYCEKNFFSANECIKFCPDGGKRCGYTCCTSNRHCSGGECECNSPLVVCGAGCCKPSETPRDPKTQDNLIQRWLNTLGATSAGHGGGGRSVRAAAPVAGAGGAVLALAAVEAQGGAALAAFTDGHRDSKFTNTAIPAKASLAKLQAGPGLDAGSATALNALLAANVRANALIAAAATSLARSRGAIARHNRSRARKQLLASARFVDQAVKILQRVPGLRARAAAALQAGATVEIVATADQVSALQSSVRSSGVPADLRALLAGLGVKGRDLAHVRTGMLQSAVGANAIAGPVLVAPLADSGGSALVLKLVMELQIYATSVRQHPIVTKHR